jgi:hypothetical protein
LGIEAQGLVEAAHSYSVLNRLTVATEMRLAISSCDRHDIVVNVRGPGLVEPDFLLAIEFAFPEGAEIHKVESHRLLDLVGEITGKNYPGNMGLNEFDVAGGMVESSGFKQSFDENVVNGGDLWRSSVHWAFPLPASLVVPIQPC